MLRNGAGSAPPAASSASRQAVPGVRPLTCAVADAEDGLRIGGDLRSRPPQDRTRQRVDPVDGDPGFPETGRRGQVRVQTTEIGPQLVGEVGGEGGQQHPRAGLERRASMRARCSSTTVLPVPAPPDSRNGPE